MEAVPLVAVLIDAYALAGDEVAASMLWLDLGHGFTDWGYLDGSHLL